MKRSVFPHRGWRAAAVALPALALCLAVAASGCGNKKSPPDSQGTSFSAEEEAREAETRTVPADRAEPVATSGGDITVFVVPSSPSRIAPPSLSVRSHPGQGAQITGVRWIVNGSERAVGDTLASSLFERGDEIEAEVNLLSGNGESLLKTEKVRAVNSMPAVIEVGIEPRAPTAGGTVRAVVSAQDPDGDPLTFKYQWFVDDVQASGEGDSLPLKGIRKGSRVHVAVTPNDGFGDGAWKYSPRHEIVNAPPVVKSQAPTTIPSSRVLAHTIVAEDPDGDPLTYALVKGNERTTLDGSTLVWNVSDEDLGRPLEIVIRISDNDGGETVLTMNLIPRKP